MIDSRFFNRQGPFSLSQLAEVGSCELILPLPAGLTPDSLIHDIGTLADATSGQVAVLHNSKYKPQFLGTKATLCVVSRDMIEAAPEGVALLVSETPYRAFAMIAAHFYPETDDVYEAHATFVHPDTKIGRDVVISPGAVVQRGAEIGDGSRIGPNAVIGKNVVLGQDCRIGAGATISHALVGNHVVIGPGARIGQAGFGFFMDQKGHVPVPQLGRVVIEDRVDIGANTTIDRAGLGETFIGMGTRIDNLVQIAHGVKLGRHCVIVAQVGISGSTEFGNYVIAAGQAGFGGHIKIGDGARIAGQSGVMRDLGPGETVAGTPAVPATQWHRQTVTLSRLVKERQKKP
ncbi:MAG: UDP-3-O-(3-hydroxymyristoyl)glucosamine N-acyltransferase [Holosporales bacterium]